MYIMNEFHSFLLFISLLHLKIVIIYTEKKIALETLEEQALFTVL